MSLLKLVHFGWFRSFPPFLFFFQTNVKTRLSPRNLFGSLAYMFRYSCHFILELVQPWDPYSQVPVVLQVFFTDQCDTVWRFCISIPCDPNSHHKDLSCPSPRISLGLTCRHLLVHTKRFTYHVSKPVWMVLIFIFECTVPQKWMCLWAYYVPINALNNLHAHTHTHTRNNK